MTPYSPQALDKIRAGACARDLGWDEQFYSSVCRRHGLTPNVPAVKTHIAPEIAASPPLVPPPLAPVVSPSVAPVTGQCFYQTATRTLFRGTQSIVLPSRQSDVFNQVAKGTPDTPMNGMRLATLLQIDPTGGVGGHVASLNRKMATLGLVIVARRGRDNSGYWIADIESRAPVQVSVVGAGAKA